MRKLDLSRNELTSAGVYHTLIEFSSEKGKEKGDVDFYNDDAPPRGDPPSFSSPRWELRSLRELNLSYNRLNSVHVEEGANIQGDPQNGSIGVINMILRLQYIFKHLEQLNLAGNLLGGLPAGLDHVSNVEGVPYGSLYMDYPKRILDAVGTAIYSRARVVAKYDRYLATTSSGSSSSVREEGVWTPPHLSVNLNDNNFANDRVAFHFLLSVITGTNKTGRPLTDTLSADKAEGAVEDEEDEVDSFIAKPLPVSVLGTRLHYASGSASASTSASTGGIFNVPDEITSATSSDVRLKHYPHVQTVAMLVEKQRKESWYHRMRHESRRGGGAGDGTVASGGKGKSCFYTPLPVADSDAQDSNLRYRQHWTKNKKPVPHGSFHECVYFARCRIFLITTRAPLLHDANDHAANH